MESCTIVAKCGANFLEFMQPKELSVIQCIVLFASVFPEQPAARAACDLSPSNASATGTRPGTERARGGALKRRGQGITAVPPGRTCQREVLEPRSRSSILCLKVDEFWHIDTYLRAITLNTLRKVYSTIVRTEVIQTGYLRCCAST